MRHLIYIILMLILPLSAVFAQDDDVQVILNEWSSDGNCSCGQGSVTMALLLGNGTFLDTDRLSAPQVTTTNGYIPVTNISANNNSATNIIGIELRYFVSDQVAIKASGGALVNNNPSVQNIPGIADPRLGGIPTYASVNENQGTDINGNLGFEYHFKTPNPNMFFWVGATGSYYQARRATYDPGYDVNEVTGDLTFRDLSLRSTDVTGWSAQQTFGIDYYIAKGLYLGIETKPIIYTYAYAEARSAADLEPLTTELHDWSFLAQTFIKLGFELK